MLRILLFVLALHSFAFSIDITLEFLESKPKGLARDFYIWRFLSDEKTNLQDALKAYELIFRKNAKLTALVEKKGMPHELPKDLLCKKLDFDTLLTQDMECIVFGLRLSQIPSLEAQKLQKLQAVIATNENLSKKVQILSSKAILTNMLTSDAKTFAQIFNALSENQKATIINQNIKPQRLKVLAEEQNAYFDKIIQNTILSDSLPKFKKSLLNAHIKKTYSGYTLFLLGIHELLANNKTNALEYFALAQNASKDPLFINKALFWRYLVSQNKALLSELAKSTNIDIYTLYALEKLNTAPNYTILSGFENLKSEPAPFDISDPFQWEILRANLLKVSDSKNLLELLDEFGFEGLQPHLAFIHARATKFQNNYFLTPFSDSLSWKDTSQKALTYAIARQESHFLPALISTSYALGMMQIMPFNVAPFAKSMGKQDIELEDMFNPVLALEFGRFYLDELRAEFKHPLLVSYAYNGGPGFLRRTLKKGNLFLKKRKFEPWISMELIPYEESRTYGLKVLANYIVYQRLFGNNTRLENIIKQIPLR
ncbi:lytic transglycosylase domain-containing protein [Helicobacter himalayensis]|uniref:lytic transglycosylase domain-containing protein n=1 Tax=Helicobacter himalayensis TaxID=1591088 RepID=UPI003D701547